MSFDHDHLLAPDGLADLGDRPLEEIRAQRAACVDVETGLSYVRRMVQGSLDIVEREITRRSGNGDVQAVGDLIDQLPGILGDAPRPPGVGRLSQTLEPTDLDDALVTEFEELVGDGRLAQINAIDESELHRLVSELKGIEGRISEKRRAYFDRIDALQAEITRRYQTGEASVESLLESS